MSFGTSQYFPNGADIWSATASAAVLALTFVKQTTTQEENYKCATAGVGEDILGIAVADAEAGEPVGVATSSIGMLKVNGSGTAIAAGDKLTANATGLGIKAGVSTVYGAVALEPASTNGAEIRVLIRHGITPAA